MLYLSSDHFSLLISLPPWLALVCAAVAAGAWVARREEAGL